MVKFAMGQVITGEFVYRAGPLAEFLTTTPIGYDDGGHGNTDRLPNELKLFRETMFALEYVQDRHVSFDSMLVEAWLHFPSGHLRHPNDGPTVKITDPRDGHVYFESFFSLDINSLKHRLAGPFQMVDDRVSKAEIFMWQGVSVHPSDLGLKYDPRCTEEVMNRLGVVERPGYVQKRQRIFDDAADNHQSIVPEPI